MRALLLAGGIGSRLRPLTETIPKCLVPVHGRPLLDYWLDLLFGAGIERALLNTHWLAPQVREHVGRSPWAARIDLVHEDQLLGTGGTVLANREWFLGEPFLVAHADNLTDFDVKAFIEAHEARPPACKISMLAFRTDDPSSCGILELDSRGIVVAFHEKQQTPPGNLANGAVYIFEPEVVGWIASLGKPVVDLSTEVIPAYLHRILSVETQGYHRDIGNLESLRRAHSEFKEG
ncbi:nucleotidyltransferase family protein [Bradyrhizobium liaoningense]|uniref:nucleotidyltransferase family protein n=1 Tax=Bradyrhizobium liaoningense TaxID=43992 RepID=UPI001BA8B0F9|nr:nucleotidyltransferase family protein [Bradyrhizobium liaoningense]MBR0856657.1 nucleotidyltransferase family protein [Bradyrhizobium liaoningense]